MDCFCGKKKSKQCEQEVRGLSEKVRVLEEEIKAVVCEREKECRGYERDVMVFAFKEAEWKQEKGKLKEEVKRLRKLLEDKEEKFNGENNNLSVPFGNTTCSFLVEQMREERLCRDEAVEKWKKLYLAIKTELDDLIQKTHRDGLYWKAEEEEIVEELRLEVKAKEETIEDLKERLAIAEHEEFKRARELDILKQSLRITSSKKASSFPLSKPKNALVKRKHKRFM